MTEVMYFQTAGYTGFEEQPTDLAPNGDGFYTLWKNIAIDYPISLEELLGRIAEN
jgi:hypothetical protein